MVLLQLSYFDLGFLVETIGGTTCNLRSQLRNYLAVVDVELCRPKLRVLISNLAHIHLGTYTLRHLYI